MLNMQMSGTNVTSAIADAYHNTRCSVIAEK